MGLPWRRAFPSDASDDRGDDRGDDRNTRADTDADTDTDADAELAEWIDGEELLTVTAEIIEVIDTEDV